MPRGERDTAALPHKIVLTGFMGTGKSTVGRILAHRIRFEFIDTDQVIEEMHGPIPELFERLGEDGFRDIESALVVELAARQGVVIATGGGLMLRQENADALAADSEVFCLDASVDTILGRVTSGRQLRPLIEASDNPRQTILTLLAEREDSYAQFTRVSTDGLTPSGVASLLAVKAAMATQAARRRSES